MEKGGAGEVDGGVEEGGGGSGRGRSRGSGWESGGGE